MSASAARPRSRAGRRKSARRGARRDSPASSASEETGGEGDQGAEGAGDREGFTPIRLRGGARHGGSSSSSDDSTGSQGDCRVGVASAEVFPSGHTISLAEGEAQAEPGATRKGAPPQKEEGGGAAGAAEEAPALAGTERPAGWEEMSAAQRCAARMGAAGKTGGERKEEEPASAGVGRPAMMRRETATQRRAAHAAQGGAGGEPQRPGRQGARPAPPESPAPLPSPAPQPGRQQRPESPVEAAGGIDPYGPAGAIRAQFEARMAERGPVEAPGPQAGETSGIDPYGPAGALTARMAARVAAYESGRAATGAAEAVAPQPSRPQEGSARRGALPQVPAAPPVPPQERPPAQCQAQLQGGGAQDSEDGGFGMLL